jgi:hypothetical protein
LKNILIFGVSLGCLLFATTGCKHGLFQKHNAQGTIEYKIAVLDSNNPMAKFAPDKMIIKFKNNQSYAQVIAGMGLFETDFVNDEPNRKIIQMVRLLNKKVFYVADTNAVNKELKGTPKFIFTPTTETKMIAGFKCKKVGVAYADNKFAPFDLYYTEDIKLEDPNWATPFREIKGVLMGYRFNRYGFYMEFTANKVDMEDVDDKIFTIPQEYKKISKEQIDELYKSFQ